MTLVRPQAVQSRAPHEGSKPREYAELIHRSGDSAAALTRQLLAFSRRQVLPPELLDLAGLVSGVCRMLARLRGERIEIEAAPAVGACLVHADRSQLEQVVLNLAVNARDAMPEGGRLRLLVAEVELDETACRDLPGCAPGPHVMLEVRDTGHGMDEETRRRLFEPFFTTKPQGRGTGLGLATVYGIVRQSSGAIQVDSVPGCGTCFRILLPRVSGVPRETPAPDAALRLEGSETLLVADDAVAVVRLATEVLARYGYTVLGAGAAGTALETARRHAGPLHLLLTDVVMPGMSGVELAHRLALERPGVRVLFMSGYADAGSFPEALARPGAPFLQKPFSAVALARRVRETLDAVAPPAL